MILIAFSIECSMIYKFFRYLIERNDYVCNAADDNLFSNVIFRIVNCYVIKSDPVFRQF